MSQRPPVLLRMLDLMLHGVHLGVILFSVFGWLLATTRPLHLGLQGLILFSWFGLGSFKGWTYCFLTDLHWWVKRVMRQPECCESYVKLLVDKLAGRPVDVDRVNRATVSVFFITTACSLALFSIDRL